MKPRLLDLFCGAGGAAMGYHRAGFEVVGVDIKPQKHYPFEFHQADAMTYPLEGFDVIHASPPCQAYSHVTRVKSNHPDLYRIARVKLTANRAPYIIENVIGAPYAHGIFLCGTMFDLTCDGEWIQRHRNFETSWLMFQPLCKHPKEPRPTLITGHCFISKSKDCGEHSRQGSFDLGKRLMDIDWMNRKQIVQAIPPAYTEFIGKQLMEYLK